MDGRHCCAVTFDSCNSLLLFVHTTLVIILRCLRLNTKTKILLLLVNCDWSLSSEVSEVLQFLTKDGFTQQECLFVLSLNDGRVLKVTVGRC